MVRFDVGAVVELEGGVAIVTAPISDETSGHVVGLRDGHLVGMAAGLEDVSEAREGTEGFAQLAYQMIRLGSSVIEQRLLVYRH